MIRSKLGITLITALLALGLFTLSVTAVVKAQESRAFESLVLKARSGATVVFTVKTGDTSTAYTFDFDSHKITSNGRTVVTPEDGDDHVRELVNHLLSDLTSGVEYFEETVKNNPPTIKAD